MTAERRGRRGYEDEGEQNRQLVLPMHVRTAANAREQGNPHDCLAELGHEALSHMFRE